MREQTLCLIQFHKAIGRHLLSTPYLQSLFNVKDIWSQRCLRAFDGVASSSKKFQSIIFNAGELLSLKSPPPNRLLCPSSSPSETVLLVFQCSTYFSVESLAGSRGLSPSTYSTAISVHFTSLIFHLSSATLTITTHPQDEDTRVCDTIDAEDNNPHKQRQKLNSIFSPPFFESTFSIRRKGRC
jgi:hypothetical protein